MSDSVGPQPPDPDQSCATWPTPLPHPPHVPNPTVNWATKRVCFYKSGDPRFNGLNVVINNRTFKTFDALLDSLSKKVPLPFGVRNITTPRGTHAVHSLHELEDGKSYICSDQKKVKPLNLEAVEKTLPPWNVTRRLSGRRAINRASHRSFRPQDASPALQMPKQLRLFKNGNPSVSHILTLHFNRSQTFESILRQVSRAMKFPVRKLFTSDGRRLDDLSALLLCSGLVVAASQEPFRPASYNLRRPTQNILLSGGPGAEEHDHQQLQAGGTESRHLKLRKLSPSSEMYFVNQMNNSITGSLSDLPSNHTGSIETKNNHLDSTETDTFPHRANGRDPRSLVPADDDIEKSFRINEDGSMTVEMKVRLTIKEEELIHWTTTLKRSTITGRVQVGCGMEAKAKSPDSLEPNSDASVVNSHKPEQDFSPVEGKASSLNMDEPRLRRRPTPGLGHVTQKQASLDSITTMSDTEVTRNMVGAYSCTQERLNGGVTEDHWLVCQTTSRPASKSRRAKFTEVEGYSASLSSDVSEVLQVQTNNEAERRESALHMCEQQSCHKKDSGNTKSDAEGETAGETIYRRSDSADTIPCSTSCEQHMEPKIASTTSESLNDKQSVTLSISPDSVSALNKITNLPSLFTDNEALTPDSEEVRREVESKEFITEDSRVSQIKETDECKPNKMQAKLRMNSSSDKCSDTGGSNEGETDLQKNSNTVKPDTTSDTLSRARKQKKTRQAKQVIKNGPKLGKKPSTGEIDAAVVGPLLPLNITNSNGLLTHEEHTQTELKVFKDDIKKNTLNVLPHSNLKKTKKMLIKQSSEREHQNISREAQHLTESVSLPTFCCGVNEYVENWLEKIQPESTDCMDDNSPIEEEPRVVFQIGSEFLEESEESCEIKMFSENKPPPHDHKFTTTTPVPQNLLEMALDQVQNDELHLTKTFSNTASSVSAKPTVQVQPMTLRKSADMPPEYNLDPTLDPKLAPEKDSMPVLERVCSTVPPPLSQHSQPFCLEKSYSFPDLTSHTASTLSSSSKLLVAFLSAVALNQIPTNRNIFKPFKNDSSCSKALRMIESLQNVASTKDTEDLKASLLELQSINSSYLQNWRSFLELDGGAEILSPFAENSGGNFSLDANKGQNMSHDPPNDFEGLLEEFSMFVEFQKEFNNEDLTEHSEESKYLTDSCDEKNIQNETSKNDLQCEDSEIDEKTQTLEEGSYEDENFSDKGERGSHKELIRKEVISGEFNVTTTATSTLTKVSTEDDLKGTSEMSRQTPVRFDHASTVQTMAKEDVEEKEAEEHNCEFLSCADIPQDVLEFIHSALRSCTLSFSYDSKGNLIIEAKETQGKKMKEIFQPKGSRDVQYSHKRLPSPNTSDFSEYRSETTDSEQFKSQESAELFTESGEDNFKKLSFNQHSSERKTEMIFEASEVDSNKPAVKTFFSSPHLKQYNNPKGSFSPLDRSCSGSGPVADVEYFNTADAVDDCIKPGQHVFPCNPVNLSEGVLIDKGRWLLKENHLIRRSPPEPMGMYGNVETTSADTGQENSSDEEHSSHLGGPASALATISSSELEELAKPTLMPQLAYFNMPHGSDSDPFRDGSSSRSSLTDAAIKESKIKKDQRLSTPTEPTTAWAKRKSSLNSFTSVQFKMPDGKVHPLDTEQATAQIRGPEAMQEQESTARRDLTCGPHCPIL